MHPRRRGWRWCSSRCRRRSAGRGNTHVINILFMPADGVWVDVESGGIRHVASGRVRYNRDVIAYLLILWKTCLRIERIAYCDIRRPCYAAVSAPRIEQLRIDVVRSVA